MPPAASPNASTNGENKPPLRLWLPQLLLMEDTRRSRVLLETTLDKGYCVDTARTLEEALRMAKIRPYDGLILDTTHSSAHVNSQVLRDLRTIERYGEAPIVAITDGPVSNVLNSGDTHWFDGYLSKPFHHKDVLDLLDHFFWHPDFF